METIARKNHDRMRMKDWIFFLSKKTKEKEELRKTLQFFFPISTTFLAWNQPAMEFQYKWRSKRQLSLSPTPYLTFLNRVNIYEMKKKLLVLLF